MNPHILPEEPDGVPCDPRRIYTWRRRDEPHGIHKKGRPLWEIQTIHYEYGTQYICAYVHNAYIYIYIYVSLNVCIHVHIYIYIYVKKHIILLGTQITQKS